MRQSILRDALGRITQISENDFSTSRTLYYRYDLAGRLYGVKLNADIVATYAYDLNGNRIAVNRPTFAVDSATYDAQDRLLSFGHQSAGYTRYTYTAAGELASKTVGGSTTSYVYDPLGNLVTVTLPNGDLIRYSSDGVGRRVGRRLNGAWTGGWVYTNALQVAADLDGTGAVVNRYVYGGDSQTPDLILNGTHTYRVIRDQLGSVRGVVDASDGTVAQQIGYDAWGVPTVVNGGTFQALGYAGGLSDQATGLVRFGARDYDPVAGRWTCKDPTFIRQLTTNAYEYCNSSPVGGIDVSGFSCRELDEWAARVYRDALVAKQRGLRGSRKLDDERVQNAYRHVIAAQYLSARDGGAVALAAGVGQEGISLWNGRYQLLESGLWDDTVADLRNDYAGATNPRSSPDELYKQGKLYEGAGRQLDPGRLVIGPPLP